MSKNSIFVLLYLGAIVLANLLVVRFGPGVTVINAFLFIGLDITSRDKLHEAWHGNRLVLKMLFLISVGGLLSWWFNRDAERIAIASVIAFSCAGLVDTFVYHVLYRTPFFVKVNGSNIFSATVDSIVFPSLAFGSFLPWVILGQWIAKVSGGAVWAIILGMLESKRSHAPKGFK